MPELPSVFEDIIQLKRSVPIEAPQETPEAFSVISGGFGLLIDKPLPAVCIGLGVGYLIKIAISSK